MSRAVQVVLLASLSACVRDRPATSVSIAAPTATSAIATPVAKVTNAPRLEVTTEGSYESWTSSWDGLPAISPDGNSVAYAYHSDDGGRGFPNLYLGVLPVGAEREQTTTIFTSEEVSRSASGLASLVQQRVAEANARLRAWSPMETFVVQDRYPEGEPQRVSVGGLEWTYREPNLVVRAHDREVFSRSLGGGPAPDDHCSYAARLRVASVDVHRRVLLVGLRYSAPPDWCPDTDVFRAFVYAAQ
jgi:hypothetical protein